MPIFSFSNVIDPKTFIDSCNHDEIYELIDYLVKTGHLKKNSIDIDSGDEVRKMTKEEIKYEESLKLLKGKYNMMSYLDAVIITELSKKFNTD